MNRILKAIGEGADFDLVKMRTTNECQATPHCNNHGAMNKITLHEDGGGVWRCLAAHSVTKILIRKSISYKQNDAACRAGCLEVRF